MKSVLFAGTLLVLMASNTAAIAQCGGDVTPRTKVALLQSAEALTKCSAFYHMLSIGSFGSQNPEAFKRWSAAAREDIVSAAMMATIAGVPGSDPTTKFDEYLRSFNAPMAADGTDWALGFSEECKVELGRGRKTLNDYVKGR